MANQQGFQTGMRAVFFVSDRTGLTAETYGRNLLAQFPQLEFQTFTLAFVSSAEKAQSAVEMINAAHAKTGVRPIVFSSLVERAEQDILNECSALMVDLFHTFLGPLEACLGMESAHKQGNSKNVLGKHAYLDRLDAIEYSLSHDDGVRPDQYDEAEVILVGVSRCGKTPTSLYLAMNFSLKVSNYPLTPEDLERECLPESLQRHRNKIVALNIRPEVLSNIREKRRPGGKYASLANCRNETRIAEMMFQRARLPQFDTTETSIEEVAGFVVKTLGISRERRGFA